jgi:Endosomal/lysosomal potassium channel TMEM175
VRRAATPERLSAFSDAVFAVLITVLVLDLRPPELSTYKALLLLWPTWLSYAVSYVFIAIVCGVAASALHRLDGREQIGSPAGFLLRGGLLPGERDLHISDLGAH